MARAPREITAYRHQAPEPAPPAPGSLPCGCPPGAHDSGDPGGFYVTVQDGGRTGLLLGPHGTHEQSLALVAEGRRIAEEKNSRAVWYRFGTSRVLAEADRRPGLLNSYLEA